MRRITISKRTQAKLKELKGEIMQRRHQPIPEQGRWLHSVVLGHFAYYAVPGNLHRMEAFKQQVKRHWAKALRRRSQRRRWTWERFDRLVDKWLPPVRNMHPYPEQRFYARHPR